MSGETERYAICNSSCKAYKLCKRAHLSTCIGEFRKKTSLTFEKRNLKLFVIVLHHILQCFPVPELNIES